MEHMRNLRSILLLFEATSGLRINLRKSKILGIGDCPIIGELAIIMGCHVGSLPLTYLSLPLGISYRCSPHLKRCWIS